MSENGKRKGSSMNIKIAQRLYELRRKHGFSQESLAAKLGLSRQAISKWERSESAPDMGNLIALADLYGMTIDELIRPAVEGDAESEAADVATEIVHDAVDDAVDGSVDATETAEVTGDIVNGAVDEAADEEVEEPAGETYIAPVSELVGKTIDESMDEPTKATIVPPTPNVEQVCVYGDAYTQSSPQTAPRCKLRSFPYPLFVTVVFLILALVFSLWEYIWLFLTIPFYYWIARIIERDPNFLTEHGYKANNAAEQPVAPYGAAEPKGVR